MAFHRPSRVLGVVLSLLVAQACSPAAASPVPSAPPSAPSTSAPSPAGDDLTALVNLDLTLDGGPDFPVAAFGSLWVLRPDLATSSITRLDPGTGAIQADVVFGGRLCQATGVSPAAIWVCSQNGLTRIDPATNKANGEVAADIGQYYGQLPFGAGSLWALGGKVTLTDTLLRIDPERAAMTDSVPLGFNGGGLAFAFDAVWITAPAEGKLVRFDPVTGALTDHTTGLDAPRWVTAGFGSLWVGLHDEKERALPNGAGTVARLDLESGEVVAMIVAGVDPRGAAIHAGSASVWVRAPTPFLARIDPATNAVTDSIEAEHGQGGVVEIDGRIWVTAGDMNSKVWRLAIGP